MSKKNEEPLACQSLTIEDSLKELNTSRDGLNIKEAENRLDKHGKNKLPGKKAVKIWQVILNQVKSPLIYILIAAGILSFVIGEIKDGVFIFFVIFLNTGLGTYQEWRAEKSAESMQEYLRIYARVRREGKEKSINAEELVPGDIVILKSGDKVPADLRLLKTKNLSIDESILTGESLPVKKGNRKEKEDKTVSECENIAFAGTRVTSGRATGMVVKTGLDTEIGKITEEVQSRKEVKPPLLIRMDKFSKQIGIFVLGGIVILAVIAISQGYDFLEVFLFAVALAVSAIPAGLPVAVTVALSISSNRMADRNVIIRKLAAVESLGSCTLIASDKTGTLTVNKQTARMIIPQIDKRFKVSGEGYNDKGKILDEDDKQISEKVKDYMEKIAKVTAIDNEAELKKEEDAWEYEGNPIDIAFLALAYKLGLDPEKISKNIDLVGEIPFESENRFSAKFYREKKTYSVASKGAPEVIIPLCDKMNRSGRFVGIDRKKLKKRANELAREGYRVIAVAGGRTKKRKKYDDLSKEDLPRLNFLGLVGFIDPIRPGTVKAINKSRLAGVKVIMMTGDNLETALTIAKELDIASEKDEVVSGSELGEESEDDKEKKEEFKNMIKSKKIFARITPIQKLKIVEVLKEIGNFVAVTGDGVNDTPALKRANIGVAMGSGTDVTKDTASIIVTDDSFNSIVSGIEEGRFAYDNIRKVTYLLISTGVAEVILFIAALLAGLPLALVAIQLLWLNLVTNGIQDVALAFEKGESGAMERPPRDPSEGIFDKLMFQQVIISGLFMGGITIGIWYYLINNGWETKEARNILLLLMVLLQNFHIFNCRSERTSAFRIPISRNYLLIAGVIAAQGIHIGSMYVPFMQDLLGVSPISISEWGILVGIAFSIVLVMELFKLIRKKIINANRK